MHMKNKERVPVDAALWVSKKACERRARAQHCLLHGGPPWFRLEGQFQCELADTGIGCRGSLSKGWGVEVSIGR